MKLFRRNSGLLALFLLGVMMVVQTNVAFGQVTAAVSGRIQDPSGAAIPEATITVTNTETGAARTVTTDAGGSYRALSLQVGRYEIRAEKTGFKTASQAGINLAVGQEGVVNISMEVGAVTEQVTVTGEAPIVNTTTASLAGLVGEKEVKELPLNGRSFDLLITLNAGTVNYTAMRVNGGAGTPQGNRFSVAGRRPSENYFLLNGVELTGPNQDQTIPWGVSGTLLGVDAIREFNVATDAYGAEYGKRAGAQVSMVTQSGTNQLHGTLFEFLRNSVLDARNYFDTGTIPPFKRNQFGGSAGGPIKRDKTFIFGNYEGLRYRLGTSSVAQVPDNFARDGLLPCSSGGIACPDGVAAGTRIPVPGLQQGMLPYVKGWWPAPNSKSLTTSAGLPTGVAEFVSSPLDSIREEYGTVRVDHNISSSDTLSGNYTIDDGFRSLPLSISIFSTGVALRYQVASLHETHVFSPSLINTVTAGFSRVGYGFVPEADSSFPESLALVPGAPPGLLTVGAGTGGGGAAGAITSTGSSTAALARDYKTIFTYTDQLQLVKGRHQFNVGTWWQRQRDNGGGNSTNLGRADFASLPALLQGTVQSFRAVPREITKQWRQWAGAWYVEDNIQLRPNLTLRVGLRHEFQTRLLDPRGKAANWAFTNGVLETNTVVGQYPGGEINNQKWLFSPRIGLAWDPRGNGRTSIRAAIGTYYNVQDNLTTTMQGSPPFNATATFLNQQFLSIAPVRPDVVLPPTCGPGVPAPCLTFTPRGFPPDFKVPTAEEWNFSIEQQVTTNTSFRMAYVGSQSYHNIVIKDVNSIAPLRCTNAAGCRSGGVNAVSVLVPQGTLYVPVGTRPNPALASSTQYFNFEGTTNYNALQLELKKRFAAGLLFKGNYTWSKILDQGSGEGLGQGMNTTNIMTPYDVGYNNGPSAHDFTHQASFSGSYELPIGPGKPLMGGLQGVGNKLIGGWQFNWIVSLTSGYPIIPRLGANVSGNGDGTAPDRPNWNPAFTGKVITGTQAQWFDPRAFLTTAPGTWGDMGVGVLRGPGLANLDLSLFKSTTLTERINLQFRAEFFNILNHTNLGFPNTAIFSAGQLPTAAQAAAGQPATPTINPAAGGITFTATTSRQIQFGLKLNF